MDMTELSRSNLQDLEMIRELIEVEDGSRTTIDEALKRVLSFYKRFVPFD